MTPLPTHTVEKIWGRRILPPPFTNAGDEPVGEIWFDPPAEMPELLVKYLFTSERLSVQVHPSDAQAPPGSRGKEECWFILDAEPGARLAIGFEREIAEDQLRAAALNGSIEDLLAWHEVEAGDFFYLPAGTVHAIGPGLSLIEVQQNSDITYRLYDYGRPRELHLEESIAVSKRGPYHPKWFQKVRPSGHQALVEGPHFRLDRLDGAPDAQLSDRYRGRALLIPIEGHYSVAGASIVPGSCAMVESVSLIASTGGKALIAQPS